jgi:hypothetical protein
LPQTLLDRTVAQQHPLELRRAGAQRPARDLRQAPLQNGGPRGTHLVLRQAEPIDVGQLSRVRVDRSPDSVLVELRKRLARGKVIAGQLTLQWTTHPVEQVDNLEGPRRSQVLCGLDIVQIGGELTQRHDRTHARQVGLQTIPRVLAVEGMVRRTAFDPTQHALPPKCLGKSPSSEAYEAPQCVFTNASDEI